MLSALRGDWPEFASEAAGLALFMLSACALKALLEHPGSSLHQRIDAALLRRMWMGLAMGARPGHYHVSVGTKIRSAP
jgi:hypothetical protein